MLVNKFISYAAIFSPPSPEARLKGGEGTYLRREADEVLICVGLLVFTLNAILNK